MKKERNYGKALARFRARLRLPRRRLTLGVGAIFKNEAPYILEWVAFHRAMGIDYLFIADNNSDDGTTEILAALDAAGFVAHIPFPHVPDQPPQLAAYDEIIKRHAREVDWLAFIDADEFLLPTDGQRSLRPFFEELDKRRDIGAVVVNWATYGSSGRQEASEELVIRRFTCRGPKEWGVNRHYKTVVRASARPGTRRNPHRIGVGEGFSTVSSSGEPLRGMPGREGLSATVDWSRLRINHYVVKSRQEFFERKRPKGRATVVGRLKTEEYFGNHDRNNEEDPMPPWAVANTEIELLNLQQSLSRAGAPRYP